MGLVPTRWYLMLLMPSMVSVVLLALGMLVLMRRSRRATSWRRLRTPWLVSLSGLALLYVCSTPLVATVLSRSLERMTPYVRAEDAPNADAIVVLGGGQSGYLAPKGQFHAQGGRGGDRLEQGIRAFKAGKAPLLAVGGGTFGLPGGEMVGDYLRDQALSQGVPAAAVLACGDAKYTSDEGASIAALLKPRGVRSILLCTSATHLPRARLTYERLGFSVTGIPCDFDTRGEGEGFSPLMMLPRGQALFQTENALKEWLGLMAGWMSGYQ